MNWIASSWISWGGDEKGSELKGFWKEQTPREKFSIHCKFSPHFASSFIFLQGGGFNLSRKEFPRFCSTFCRPAVHSWIFCFEKLIKQNNTYTTHSLSFLILPYVQLDQDSFLCDFLNFKMSTYTSIMQKVAGAGWGDMKEPKTAVNCPHTTLWTKCRKERKIDARMAFLSWDSSRRFWIKKEALETKIRMKILEACLHRWQ